MDILIPEIQQMIYFYAHKLYMKEVFKDFSDTTNKKNIAKGEMYRHAILSGGTINQKRALEEKIDHENHRQYLIDSGKYTLEEINCLTKFYE